jgi:hypothetical protein
VPLTLSLLGLSLAIVGSVLLFMYKEPRFGHSLMLSSYNERANKIGARLGICAVVLGSMLQLVAVIIA